MKRLNRGLTLIEVLIATAILALLFAAIFVLVFQGGSTYADASRNVVLQRGAREALERISEELRYAQPLPTAVETPGSGYIQYRKSIGFDGTDTIWSTPITIQLESSPADANNNGLSDDLQLTRTQEVTEYPAGVATLVTKNAVICDYVKPYDAAETDLDKRGGFTITRSTVATGVYRYKLEITLAVFDSNQKEMLTKVSTSVVLRKQLAP